MAPLRARDRLVRSLEAARRSPAGERLRSTRTLGIVVATVRRRREGARLAEAFAAAMSAGGAAARLAGLPASDVVRLGYDAILQREPAPAELESYGGLLASGTWSPHDLVEMLTASAEWRFEVPRYKLAPSLHMSRCEFVQSLPAARRILDLGGTSLGNENGALVSMGYPYEFDELVIVDLPPDERHELYHDRENPRAAVVTRRGTVRYAYHSMSDLRHYGDGSFDLVYSGQSIEHVTAEEVPGLLAEVRRVLRPGGRFALDTPNARVTRLQQAEFIDPDHKYEYTHEEMARLLAGAGFVVSEAQGMN